MTSLPNFIIVGVQKSGTTSIYSYLDQHPQIYLSPVKEPHFLERDWENYYLQGKARNPKRIDTFEKYEALFEGVTNEIAIGEASLNCLFHHDESIPQILKYVPETQIIIILRNPAERAYSDYLMHMRDAINSDGTVPFSYIIKERFDRSYITQKGFYSDGVKHFRDVFGTERVHIFLYDDLRKDTGKFLKDIYRAIKVDTEFEADFSKRAQTAQVPKNKTVNRILNTKNPIRSTVASGLRRVMPLNIRQQIRSSIVSLNSSDKSAAPFSPDDRSALVQLYREDILRLQDLLQRDLSNWLT